MGFYGDPLSYLPSFIQFYWWPELIYICNVCVLVVPQLFTNHPGPGGHVPWLAHLDRLRTRSHVRLTGYANPSHMVEANSRARPAFELGVDSPGVTRSCASLVRGTLTYRSFGRLPSQVEIGRTCEAYDGQLVHPYRVKSFQKAVSTVMDDSEPTHYKKYAHT